MKDFIKMKIAFIFISILSLTSMAAERDSNLVSKTGINNLHWLTSQLNIAGPIACSGEDCNEIITTQCVEISSSQECEKFQFINVRLNDATRKTRVSYLSSPMNQNELQEFSIKVNSYQLKTNYSPPVPMPFSNTLRVIANPFRYHELILRFPLDIVNLLTLPYNVLSKDNQTHLQRGSKYPAGSDENSIIILNFVEFHELDVVIDRVTELIFPEFNYFEYKEIGYPPSVD